MRGMDDVVSLLAEGDMRTVRGVDTAVQLALQDPTVIAQLIACLKEPTPSLRMRAADALQKIHAQQPCLLEPHTNELCEIFLQTDQQEVCWNLAQVLPTLPLTKSQVKQLSVVWQSQVKTAKSSLVRTGALQALHEIAVRWPAYQNQADEAITYALAHGTPAMQARARHLLD